MSTDRGLSQPCAACGAPAHPATWHAFSPTCVLCGACARDFAKWFKRHTARRWGRHRFYDFAKKSGDGDE